MQLIINAYTYIRTEKFKVISIKLLLELDKGMFQTNLFLQLEANLFLKFRETLKFINFFSVLSIENTLIEIQKKQNG